MIPMLPLDFSQKIVDAKLRCFSSVGDITMPCMMADMASAPVDQVWWCIPHLTPWGPGRDVIRLLEGEAQSPVAGQPFAPNKTMLLSCLQSVEAHNGFGS